MQWIDTPAGAASLRQWGELPAVAMDTEFMREKTFFPELALIQLGSGDHVMLLDAPKLGALPDLKDFLKSPSIKVMHSASEDLQALQHTYGCVPAALFDTQIAAGLAGMDPSLSYQKLVSELCGVSLEKGETRSDWLRRPLSEAQLSYAADDVRYLLQPYEALAARLDALGRRAWLDEDCQRALELAVAADDRHPHLALRPAQGLPPPAQARLCRLLRWRDAQARESNRPRSWMLDSNLAVELAQRAPLLPTTFNEILDRNPKSPRRRRDELLELVNREPDAEELDIPLAELPDPNERDQIKRLQQAVSARAQQLGVQDSVLASRRHLETLIREGRWSRQLSGWRRELLHATLLPLLPATVRQKAEA